MTDIRQEIFISLFDGEKIDFNFSKNTALSSKDHDSINKKYESGEVRIVTEQARYPLNTITNMIDSGDYDLNPDFQRRKRWGGEKQSRLIESFIMNVPIPPIFLYESEYSKYEVMDGLQRLTAIYEFYQNRYALSGLEQWPELNGMTYGELPEQVRRGVDRRYLSSIILLQETAKSDIEALRRKQMVFERLNSGGEKLEPQESRNALYGGPLNELCIELAKLDSFRRMWRIPTQQDLKPNDPIIETGENEYDQDISDDDIRDGNAMYRKMQDVELVLRFFAYRQISSADQGRLRDYLDQYLKQGNNFSESLLVDLSVLFTDTSNLIYEILGDKAFLIMRRRKGEWYWMDRPTKVIYDPIMHAFSKFIDKKANLLRRSDDIQSSLRDFYIKEEKYFAGRSTNHQDIFRRMILFEKFLEQFTK